MERFNAWFGRFGIYRNVDQGWITGVCAGIADRLRVKPLLVRIAFVGAASVTHFVVPLILYLLLAFLMKSRDRGDSVLRPAGLHMAYRDLADTVTAPRPSPGGQLGGLKARFAALDMRLNDLEAAVMTDELSLRRKFRDIGG